jgi:hypothetical protein
VIIKLNHRRWVLAQVDDTTKLQLPRVYTMRPSLLSTIVLASRYAIASAQDQSITITSSASLACATGDAQKYADRLNHIVS